MWNNGPLVDIMNMKLSHSKFKNVLSCLKWVFSVLLEYIAEGFLGIPFSMLCYVTQLPFYAHTWLSDQLLICRRAHFQTGWIIQISWPSWLMWGFRCKWTCHVCRTHKDERRWALTGAEEVFPTVFTNNSGRPTLSWWTHTLSRIIVRTGKYHRK